MRPKRKFLASAGVSATEAFACLMFAACSSGCSNGDTGNPPAIQQTERVTSVSSSQDLRDVLAATGPSLPTPDAGTTVVAAPTGSTASPFAVALEMQPSTRCSIFPEGSANDPAHNATVFADGNGELRFFTPPSDWGTRITLQCDLTGTSQQAILVDLNDNSTFVAKSRADLEPQFIGTRPALTGDLSSIPLPDLIQQGYPPRPDPANSPDRYAIWAERVATPMRIFEPVPIALLSTSFGGAYDGTYSGNWAGIVQSSSGFNTSVDPANAVFGTFYDMYFADTLLPANAGCASGDSCVTAIWAGIGGYNTNGIFGGTFHPDLIQSGFALQSGINLPSPGAGTFLFTEFAPGTGAGTPSLFLPPSGDTTATFDEFGLWGWTASSASGCALSTTATVACFSFDDYTQSWGFGANAQNPPGDNAWVPSTVDYVAETPRPFNNTYYWVDIMEGEGWDFSGADHPDPGSGSDAYVDVTATGSSVAAWYNGTTFQFNPPVDPIYFVWQTF